MKASILYRIAAALLVLYAAGHTFGFRRPSQREDARAVVSLMKSVRLDVQGSERSFWDFYVGFGLFCTAFLLLSAVLAWQLGGLSGEALRQVPSAATWGLAVCFAVTTVLTWRYFFIAPGVFSTLVTICLVAAAWLAGRP
jgi:hypothetical protein